MKIVSRFIHNGKNCYMVEEAPGLVYAATERGLYEETVLSGLKEAGYEILDYHGNIITPQGVSIKDLVEMPNTASANELKTMIEVEESCVLTEAEATQYFTRKVEVKEVKMKEPKVEIHTREELIEYLKKIRRTSRFGIQDVRPLNSFVAREALFTIEELNADEGIRDLYSVIEGRRRFESMGMYRKLIEFLQSEGVLGDTYTLYDVIKAYNAWGVCGLRGTVTNVYHKNNVYAQIYARNDAADMSVEARGRLEEYCIYGKDGEVHSSFGSANWMDEDDAEKSAVAPTTAVLRQYMSNMRRTDSWGHKYQIARASARRSFTRLYVEFTQDNGLKVVAKFDPNVWAIVTNDTCIMHGVYFRIKTVSGEYLPIYDVDSEEKLALYNLSYELAVDMIKSVTVKSPVESSFDLLRHEGLSDIAAIRYITKRIEVDPELNSDLKPDFRITPAWYYYMKGPSQETISMFNPKDYEYDNLDELIEIMGATRDEMVDAKTYPLVDPMSTGNRDFVDYEMPIELLEFVKSIKQGDIVIDNIAAGRKLDNSVRVDDIAKLFSLVVLKELEGCSFNLVDIQNVLGQIRDGKLIDISMFTAERDAEYKGYLKDKAKLDTDRYLLTNNLVWVTKVYREISNQTPDKQRHYAFECLVFPIDDRHKKEIEMHKTVIAAVREALGKAIPADVPQQYKELYLNMDVDFGTQLLFKLILKKAVVEEKGSTICVKEKVRDIKGDTMTIEVVIEKDKIAPILRGDYCDSRNLVYCTLHDWCTYEIDPRGCFDYSCVNATITPWYVTPRNNSAFNSYNYMINYLDGDTLQAAKLPPVLYEMISTSNAKVSSIASSWYGKQLVSDDIASVGMEYKPETISMVLNPDFSETFENYYTRWIYARREVKARGGNLMVVRIPLKSDVTFENYAKPEDNIVTNSIEVDELISNRENSFYLTKVEPLALSSATLNVTRITDGNKISRFEYADYSYDDFCRWGKLVSGAFNPKGLCLRAGNYVQIMTAKGKAQINLKTVTQQQLETLVEKEIVYKLSADKYLIIAGQPIVVEVL